VLTLALGIFKVVKCALYDDRNYEIAKCFSQNKYIPFNSVTYIVGTYLISKFLEYLYAQFDFNIEIVNKIRYNNHLLHIVFD
jgi:hypothetical protein